MAVYHRVSAPGVLERCAGHRAVAILSRGDVQLPPALNERPGFQGTTSRSTASVGPVLPGDPPLTVGIPAVNLAGAKLEQVAAARLYPGAVGAGGEHRPFRNAAVARDEMPGVLEPDVGQELEEVRVRFADLGRAGIAASPRVLAAGRFVHALRGHHFHDRIEVVAAPRGDVGHQEIVMRVAPGRRGHAVCLLGMPSPNSGCAALFRYAAGAPCPSIR